jgi:hypothetical protein
MRQVENTYFWGLCRLSKDCTFAIGFYGFNLEKKQELYEHAFNMLNI